LSIVAAILFFLVCPHTSLAVRDGGYDVTSNLWAKAVLQVSGSPVTLVWKVVGTDITPSGDQVISGYFYADPNDFAYGSQYNPELFVKIYIAKSGWCNIAFNHVTVDNVTVYSAHKYAGAAQKTGTVTLEKRLVEHQYNGVVIENLPKGEGVLAPGSIDSGYVMTSGLWAKAILQPSIGSVTLIWKQAGFDITPSGDKVVSGYFYADPGDFAYGSEFNPEVFVKIYIAKNGWCNIAFNHVTVDNVSIYSAHNYVGSVNQSGTASFTNRLVEVQYDGVKIDVTVPGVPSVSGVTVGDGIAIVAFSAPTSNGGSAITGYIVTSNPGGITATGTISPITVTGLTNGTAYTFTVQAINGVGTSAASAASNSVIPNTIVGGKIPAPALFFTDITNGPITGGQGDLGAFITIYGERFGAQRGSSTVTIGGTEVASYVIWGQDNGIARSLDMIVVQPGPNVTSGNIVVTVNGQASNALPFTVRSGNIYFVIPGAPNADDTNPGTYTAPFKTLYRPRQVMQPGDIVYVKGGTFNTADPMYPDWDAVLLLHTDTDPNGTADRPIAYIGYPGDRPVINAPQPLRRGIYMDEAMTYYIIANLGFTQVLSPYEAMLAMSGNGHRAVGNYFYDGLASTALGIAGNSAHCQIFGNLLRNNGPDDNMEDGVGFYLQGFGTNQDIDFGWNQIQDQRGRRAIQLFGHADGDRMDNIRIHDNLIAGSPPLRNNILLGGSDGGTEVLGTIRVYNNIVVGSEWGGLRVNDPQGTVIIQNNVLYDNGTPGFEGNAQLFIERAGAGRITVQDNILYAESGQTYYEFGPGADSSALNASHNLVYNAGPCPAWEAGCVNANPLFVDLASNDFRLQASSPAVNAGINTGISRDYIGISRPQGAAYDIGALELSPER
jgi:hypothetical protein